MKFEFPDTGEGVTEGKFLEWKVDVGDTVEEDQIVGEAETDKAVVEIPAPADGKVEELKAEPGDQVEVGDVIMILDTVEVDEESDPGEEEVGEKDSEEEDEAEENTGEQEEKGEVEKVEESENEEKSSEKEVEDPKYLECEVASIA